MNRSKFVAILTGAIAILLSIVYLVLVQLLDFRGDMVPAPVSITPKLSPIAQVGDVPVPASAIANTRSFML